LLTLAAEMRAKVQFGDAEGFLEADVAFHQVLLEASGNEMFRQLSGVTEQLLRGRSSLELLPAAPAPEDAHRHAAVAEAITVGDAEAAEEAMRVIMRASVADIRERLADGAQEQ
jgi:DNA-binding FadR family transcriptional regulator